MLAELNPQKTIHIRKVESWVYQTHSALAKNDGHSLEEHIRQILIERALQAQRNFADEMEAIQQQFSCKKEREFPDSAELIQAVRDESY
ncbi:hypothetical protein PN498_13365 [Oscillatoria sp. CS-180]|uniref:hypothetical protein n=1 Tax=Oscillatoria sp. CS-180 TaxID=3021720 RepID=UPI00232AB93C|nr:hypothetical protein [Oscillatoria sp. CS-180]MDB9526983.1 hypothetical protein [Oscillatoria sp. CS-180]